MKILIVLLFVVSIVTGCKEATMQPCASEPEHKECDPSKINTRGWEDSPYITPDGKSLYFLYNPYNFLPLFTGGSPVHVGPKRIGSRVTENPFDSSDVYIATRITDGAWSTPKKLPLNTKRGSCCAIPSKDGKRLYFQDVVPAVKGGPDVNTDIVVTQQSPDGSWSPPVPISPTINSAFIEDNPHISTDEKTLIWTSTRPGGLGGKDLWIAKKNNDGTWGNAHNLGSTINSNEDEDQAWLNNNADTMYFNRGLLLFNSKLTNGKWDKATAVKFPKNIHAAEASLTADENEMYMMVVDYKKGDIILSVSKRQNDGNWSTPIPID